MIGLIMKKSVNKLVDLDIDEVSLVDRSANQHSLVSFSKSLAFGEDVISEGSMSVDFLVFNEDGEEVDSDTLEHGDVVYAEDGTELVMVEDEGYLIDVDDDVEKAFAVNTAGAVQAGRDLVHIPGRAKNFRMSNASRRAQQRGRQVGEAARARVAAAPAWALRGATAAAAGGAGYAGGSMAKSLSESILEDFSKAVNERDREEIIAKAMDEVSKAQEIASEALAYAESEHDARMEEAFISKAAEYNLPVSPEVFGPILKSLAYALDEDQLEILDAIFNAVGDALYNEYGYVGDTSNNSVLDQVDALAGEYVGKSDMTHAQAMTSAFANNPSAYDAYISENGR